MNKYTQKNHKNVSYWYDQFIKEGESETVAMYHAIQRAFELGHIDETTADYLERLVKQGEDHGRPL